MIGSKRTGDPRKQLKLSVYWVSLLTITHGVGIDSLEMPKWDFCMWTRALDEATAPHWSRGTAKPRAARSEEGRCRKHRFRVASRS